jgi:hypothetical protein
MFEKSRLRAIPIRWSTKPNGSNPARRAAGHHGFAPGAARRDAGAARRGPRAPPPPRRRPSRNPVLRPPLERGDPSESRPGPAVLGPRPGSLNPFKSSREVRWKIIDRASPMGRGPPADLHRSLEANAARASRDIRNGLTGSAIRHGSDGNGAGGLVGFFDCSCAPTSRPIASASTSSPFRTTGC